MSPTSIAAGKLMPRYYMTDALTLLFLRGAPVSSSTILLDLIVVSATNIAILIVGLPLFEK